jgi:type II secretory pathway pseudopilin PulG
MLASLEAGIHGFDRCSWFTFLMVVASDRSFGFPVGLASIVLARGFIVSQLHSLSSFHISVHFGHSLTCSLPGFVGSNAPQVRSSPGGWEGVKYLNRRTIELLSVILVVAMLVATAVPAYLKTIQKARQVTALTSIESAQKAVDSVVNDPDLSKLVASPYQSVNARTMNDMEPKFIWRDLYPGQTLPEPGGLSVRDLKSVFILNDNNPQELWIYAVSANKEILFAHGVDGIWVDSGSVPFQQGFPH